MSKVQKNVSLKPYNTFGIEAKAHYFAEIENIDELKTILQDPAYQKLDKLFLGGGSNILLLHDFQGIVLKINWQGIEITQENAENVFIKVGSGVVWHHFVMYCVSHNFAGVENLSLIPGTVGAAPMQNIGAYGIEIKDVFESLEALNLETFQIEVFDLKACRFAYRESFFKHEGKGKYLILNVTFRLDKKPTFHVEYGAIKDTLAAVGVTELSVQSISDAVIQIRQSKLPNPAEIGNAGSFFKNPEIPKTQFDTLKQKYPTIPSYPVNETKVKVPAGWLIEQAGWKGKRFGETGVHTQQALVLVNYGNAKGEEIKALAEKIQASVLENFGISLSTEVNFI